MKSERRVESLTTYEKFCNFNVMPLKQAQLPPPLTSNGSSHQISSTNHQASTFYQEDIVSPGSGSTDILRQFSKVHFKEFGKQKSIPDFYSCVSKKGSEERNSSSLSNSNPKNSVELPGKKRLNNLQNFKQLNNMSSTKRNKSNASGGEISDINYHKVPSTFQAKRNDSEIIKNQSQTTCNLNNIISHNCRGSFAFLNQMGSTNYVNSSQSLRVVADSLPFQTQVGFDNLFSTQVQKQHSQNSIQSHQNLNNGGEKRRISQFINSSKQIETPQLNSSNQKSVNATLQQNSVTQISLLDYLAALPNAPSLLKTTTNNREQKCRIKQRFKDDQIPSSQSELVAKTMNKTGQMQISTIIDQSDNLQGSIPIRSAKYFKDCNSLTLNATLRLGRSENITPNQSPIRIQKRQKNNSFNQILAPIFQNCPKVSQIASSSKEIQTNSNLRSILAARLNMLPSFLTLNKDPLLQNHQIKENFHNESFQVDQIPLSTKKKENQADTFSFKLSSHKRNISLQPRIRASSIEDNQKKFEKNDNSTPIIKPDTKQSVNQTINEVNGPMLKDQQIDKNRFHFELKAIQTLSEDNSPNIKGQERFMKLQEKSSTSKLSEVSPILNLQERSPAPNLLNKSPTIQFQEGSPFMKLYEKSSTMKFQERSPTMKLNQSSSNIKLLNQKSQILKLNSISTIKISEQPERSVKRQIMGQVKAFNFAQKLIHKKEISRQIQLVTVSLDKILQHLNQLASLPKIYHLKIYNFLKDLWTRHPELKQELLDDDKQFIIFPVIARASDLVEMFKIEKLKQIYAVQLTDAKNITYEQLLESYLLKDFNIFATILEEYLIKANSTLLLAMENQIISQHKTINNLERKLEDDILQFHSGSSTLAFKKEYDQKIKAHLDRGAFIITKRVENIAAIETKLGTFDQISLKQKVMGGFIQKIYENIRKNKMECKRHFPVASKDQQEDNLE